MRTRSTAGDTSRTTPSGPFGESAGLDADLRIRYIPPVQIRKQNLALLAGLSLLVPSLATAQDSGGASDSGSSAEFDPLSSQISRGNRATWDALFAGPPRGGMFHGEIGFSALPKLAYHMGMSADLSIGASFAFDYGYFAPRLAFTPGILLQVPIRYRIHESGQLSFGLRADPGVGMFFGGNFVFGLLLNVGMNVGYAVNNQIIVGGGVDMPIAIRIADGGSGLSWPLLFGPMFEMHVTPALALTADLKLGPWLDTGGTTFGLKFLVGLAYRF